MTRRKPTLEVTGAENLAIELCRNPEAAAALGRRLNSDQAASQQPASQARAQAVAEPGP